MTPSDSPQQSSLKLAQRPYCLLCLEAEHMFALAGIEQFERIDIERDPMLESRYGTRIPVAIDARDGRELDWPFDEVSLLRWLNGAA